MPDWIADPAGLFVADFDLLARLPDLEALDIVCTESVLASGFHERVHNWWPGLEEVEARDDARRPRRAFARPARCRPTPDGALWFTHRDREEELIAVRRGGWPRRTPTRRSSIAPPIVFKQPLPYLYLAPDVFGDAGLPYQVSDALPLAAEPVVAAVDLVLEAVETRFARTAIDRAAAIAAFPLVDPPAVRRRRPARWTAP